MFLSFLWFGASSQEINPLTLISWDPSHSAAHSSHTCTVVVKRPQITERRLTAHVPLHAAHPCVVLIPSVWDTSGPVPLAQQRIEMNRIRVAVKIRKRRGIRHDTAASTPLRCCAWHPTKGLVATGSKASALIGTNARSGRPNAVDGGLELEGVWGGAGWLAPKGSLHPLHPGVIG